MTKTVAPAIVTQVIIVAHHVFKFPHATEILAILKLFTCLCRQLITVAYSSEAMQDFWKEVPMYKDMGVRFAYFISFFLTIP